MRFLAAASGFLLDQLQAAWITVFFSVVCLESGDDGKDDTAKADRYDHRKQKEADAKKGQDEGRGNADQHHDHHRDLKIQGCFAMGFDGRKFVFLDLPHQQRPQDVSERDDKAAERAEVTQHIPGAGLALAGRLNW
jgi:hypothetical protein